MRRRNELNGKRLYFLTIEASNDDLRKIRNLMEVEGINLISERHRALTVHAFLPFLLTPLLVLYLLNIVPDMFAVWYPFAMLLVGREALGFVQ